MVPREPEAQIVPIARFWLYPSRSIWGRAIRPRRTTSPPIIPDIAAIRTAINEVMIATPPRTRLSQKARLSYICLAMPDRSSREAMKMKRGTDIRTYSVIRSKIFCVRIYSAPVPGRLVSMPSPNVSGFSRRAGSNFITSTTTARTAEAKPSGMPMPRRMISPRTRTSEIVPTSIIPPPRCASALRFRLCLAHRCEPLAQGSSR